MFDDIMIECMQYKAWVRGKPSSEFSFNFHFKQLCILYYFLVLTYLSVVGFGKPKYLEKTNSVLGRPKSIAFIRKKLYDVTILY